MNGNGSTDILWNTHPGGGAETFAFLDFATGEQPYQLKTITNGMGRTVTVSYRSSVEDMVRDRDAGNPWPKGVPFPVSVVSKIEVNDGITTYTTEYEYHNGYYDSVEKEFRGFERSEKREKGDDSAPDLIMAYTYDTGEDEEVLKGKPLTIEARTASEEVFYRENYTWKTRGLTSGAAGDERNVTFPFQSAVTRDILEKDNGDPVQLKWEYEYDDYGNMTRKAEYGRMDEGWNDERVTETTYTANYESGVSGWILDNVVETTTKDENDTIIARMQNYYDGSKNLGEVTKGNLTMVKDWVSGSKYVTSVRNDYDDYGNITAIYDPFYDQEPGHYRKITYDDAYHTFPVEENIYTGSLTLTMSATYDYRWGVMKSSTDYNGFTTKYEYDVFGRLVSITKPPDTSHTVEYDYVLAHNLENGKVINWVETKQRDGSADDGMLISRTFYDGLGRKVMTRAEGEESGQVVVTDTVQFNVRKLPWKNYLPYFETGTLDYTDPTYDTGFTEHFYDALGRDIQVNQPEGTAGVVYSTTTYKPMEKNVRDEEQTHSGSSHFGNGMRYVTDGLLDEKGNGRLRRVYEIVKLDDTGESIDDTVEWCTTYSYDLLDNLTGYVDSRNNEKTIKYDGLGRKTFMDDPDRGHMTYTYDDASNLIETLDAKGQTIRYEYDGVNRLSAEYYGNDKTEPDVAYHYDESGNPLEMGELWQGNQASEIASIILAGSGYENKYDRNGDGVIDVADAVMEAQTSSSQGDTIEAENTRGFLSRIRDQSGEEHNSYDKRGRVKWVVKRIYDNDQNTLTARSKTLSRLCRDGSTSSSCTALHPEVDEGLIERKWKQPPKFPFIKGDFNPSPLEDRNFSRSSLENGNFILSPLEKEDKGGCKKLSKTRYYENGEEDFSQGNTLRNFYSGMEYDSMDRITHLTYPDGTSIKYEYNSRGLIESVPKVIEYYDYNPSGQNKELALACGVVTTYEYDHRLRLSHLKTVRSSDDLVLQDLECTYDGVSNITGIADGRSDETLDSLGAELGVGSSDARKFNSTQSFIYDSLYRLTRATNPDVYGTINHRYDRIGNMIKQDAALLDADPLMNLGVMASGGTAGTSNRVGRKSGDQPGPHAITGTEKGPNGALTFTYDDNGNMLNDRETALSWDYKDRLISLTNGSTTARYTYDYTDTRKRKLVEDTDKGSESEVLYIDKLSEVRGGKLVKYIYAGSNRLARSEGLQSESLAIQPSAFYLHDHLGSTNITLTDNATVAEQMVNYPFGHERYARKSDPSAKLADYKFTGKETDDESGLQYFEARYLGSYMGRFISVDPVNASESPDIILYPQRLGVYAYVGNKPVRLIDPDGQEWLKKVVEYYDSHAKQAHEIIQEKGAELVSSDTTAAKAAAFALAMYETIVPVDTHDAIDKLTSAVVSAAKFKTVAKAAISGLRAAEKELYKQLKSDPSKVNFKNADYKKVASKGLIAAGKSLLGGIVSGKIDKKIESLSRTNFEFNQNMEKISVLNRTKILGKVIGKGAGYVDKKAEESLDIKNSSGDKSSK